MKPTQKEQKILKKFIKLAPDPESCFTYHELLGFLFGIAITPDLVMPSEWFPVIFDNNMPEYKSMGQVEEITGCLTGLYNKMVAAHHEEKLEFPFAMNLMDDEEVEAIYEWVSGFEEAIAMREELWDPETHQIEDQDKEELYYSLMVVQGLVDPEMVADFLENMPDQAFQETFPDLDPSQIDREDQIQLFLLASLPLSVETLMRHSAVVENHRKERQTKLASAKKGKKSNVIHVDFENKAKKKEPAASQLYELKISLQGARPPVWRRVRVPGKTSLAKLHTIIQLAMGWTNSHLHQFMIDKTCYSLPHEDDTWRTSQPKDERKFTLDQLQDKIEAGFHYIYDFGDDWMHQVKVEKILPAGEGKSYPQLLAGKRACPPEDCGGIPGYMDMLNTLSNPDDERYEEIMEWLGGEFDPARFDKDAIETINRLLRKLG